MLRVAPLQLFKEPIQCRQIILVVLADVTGADHFHHHREVLLVGRRFIVEIKDKSKQEHGRCLIPKRVLALASLGSGILEKVCHKPLNVVVVTKIDKRVITVAFLHVDEVDHLNVVALFFQEIAGVTEKFPLLSSSFNTIFQKVHYIWLKKEMGIRRNLLQMPYIPLLSMP